MTLVTWACVPPIWRAMLPQKFSAATTPHLAPAAGGLGAAAPGDEEGKAGDECSEGCETGAGCEAGDEGCNAAAHGPNLSQE